MVDVALRNSPVTRTSWAQARAAAATYGSANGRYLPTISADINGGPSKAISANPAWLPANRTTIVPTLSLQYLLFDFGARGGASSAAREGLYAADFTHNAAVQTVILQTEQAYFAYQSARGCWPARWPRSRRRRGILRPPSAGTKWAWRRSPTSSRRAPRSLRPIWPAQSDDGAMHGARATLALAMGMQPTLPFEVVPDTTQPPQQALAESVDSLIARAERDRPDFAAARALVRQGEAQVRIARSAVLPSLTLGSTAGRNFSNASALEGQTYALTFGIQIPIFSGWSRQYDIVTARENAAATAARAESARLQAAAQVYTSYHALRTAAQRVTTSIELLNSATQSEQVARGR